jgi:uncharacterized protein YgiM (DUF1202 family)
VKNWQYIGTVLTGVAALITAGIGLYEQLKTVHTEIYKTVSGQTKIKKEYGIVNDKDGWVNLRERPDVNSSSLARILNDTNLEIIGRSGNWFKVYTESGRTGYIFKDRLILVHFEK